MSRMRFATLLPLFGFLGCDDLGDSFEPYYESERAPTVTGLDITAEEGTIGGQIVTVNGSNFGDDPRLITVIFGSQNAEIVEILADTAMRVVVPRGPVEGGAVRVAVGTTHGQAILEDAYTYRVDEMYDGEVAFLAITNDYFSCLGGVGNAYGNFCANWAMSGSVGVEGRAEFLEFEYPRVHAPFTGYRGGFGGTTDASWETWAIETPSQDLNVFDHEGLYEDLRIEVESFTLENVARDGLSSGDNRWCQDMTADATFRYSGDENHSPYEVFGGSWIEEGSCNDEWTRRYDLSTMEFCQENDYDVNRSLRYVPDWPVGEYFFTGNDPEAEEGETDLVADVPALVRLSIPEMISEAQITLPESAIFLGTRGFWDDQTLTGDEETDMTLAMIAGFDEDCATSGEGDRTTSGDDTGLRWEWIPSEAEILPPETCPGCNTIESARSYVRATVGYTQQGWLGGSGTPIRAVINVPDEYNYDEETGRSALELPASILYQFPSAMQDKGSTSDPVLGDFVFNQWGDPERPDYGYIITTIERITEYRIENDDGSGYLVFSYSTGDLGYRLFFLGGDGYTSWLNPIEQAKNECNDCTDNEADGDQDGWQDADDPDCGSGELEDNSMYGIYTCNDGIDNDDDGYTDAADIKCENGYDGETNCFDDEDNDGDGLIDEEDGECGDLGTGYELGDDDPEWGCINELDDDSDGWIDFEDPDCVSGSDEEIGYGDLGCNNGIDDDFHGDVDIADPYCLFRGAFTDREEPASQTGECADGVDNDGDGYVDANDTDCEFQPYNLEDNGSFDASEWMISAECINQIDDDGDGLIDAEDSGCFGSDGEPDGFLPFEADGTENYCANGIDDDEDGWFDLDDPDCMDLDGTGAGTDEVGFSVAACNDDLDNDADGFVDAGDPECSDALDNNEAE